MLEKPYLIDLIALYYLPLKAIHILFVIAWMAGIMYLPRLFAYHARHADNPHLYGVFLTMEQRLLRIIRHLCLWHTFVMGSGSYRLGSRLDPSEACACVCAGRVSRTDGFVVEGLSASAQHALRKIFSSHERSSLFPHNRHRVPGGVEVLLTPTRNLI